MPAESDARPARSDVNAPAPVPAPALPHTWRPFGPRIAAPVFAFLLLGAFAWLWSTFDAETRATVGLLQKLTVGAIVFTGLALLYAMARSRVTATETGLTVVNGYRRRDLTWAEIDRVRMPLGAPWPRLEFAVDPASPERERNDIPILGIHGSDGARGRHAVRELKAVAAERTGRTGRS